VVHFQPIDEMSLRQLFSTELGSSVLKLSYLGPVLGPGGQIETSPDALILDMRASPYKTRRCEFKFMPSGAGDFAHNGKFEVAVIWDFGKGCSRESLELDLLEQNGCVEIVVMSESRAFAGLARYSPETINSSLDFNSIRKVILRRKAPAIVALYIAAAIAPGRFNSQEVGDYLATKFAEIAMMKGTARANLVAAWTQTKPALTKHVHRKTYEWSGAFDALNAQSILAEIVTVALQESLPTPDELKNLKI
jgi:hypothetical protein